MVCAEKTRLMDAYSAASLAFSAAVTKLRSATDAEFKQSLAARKAARTQCGDARLALWEHKDQDG
jgi:hypothetical protein